jgi:arylsulfatase A-like enzyme
MPDRKSLILVTVDCLRADHCGFMGYRRPTTRFLDGLARESFVFPSAIVAGVPTYYSFPAILASRYPLGLGREVLGLAAGEKNLASTLKEDGYATAFFGAGNPYLSAQFGYDFGFDTFRDFMDDRLDSPFDADNSSSTGNWVGSLNRTLASISHKIPGMGTAYDELYFHYCQNRAASRPKPFDTLRRFPAANVVVDHAQSWLASVGERPFFLWLHLMDPHSPYYPTQEGLELLGEAGITASRARYLNAYWNRFDVSSKRLRRHREEIVALYDAGIAWVDAHLSRLIEGLRQSGQWKNCIFAFTADHGEEFLDHGGRYHPPALREELIHVPLLLRVPGADKRELSANPFSLLHLAPTLLAASGVPVPVEFQGQNYWPHLQQGADWSQPAIAECVAGCTNPFRIEQRTGSRLLAVREARYKLLLDLDGHAESLFDLEADPHEDSPMPRGAQKPVRRRMLESALAHLRNSVLHRNPEAYVRTRLREIALHLASSSDLNSHAPLHADASPVG